MYDVEFNLTNAILEMFWEMTRNLVTHSAWLLNATFLKFFYPFYMVLIPF